MIIFARLMSGGLGHLTPKGQSRAHRLLGEAGRQEAPKPDKEGAETKPASKGFAEHRTAQEAFHVPEPSVWCSKSAPEPV